VQVEDDALTAGPGDPHLHRVNAAEPRRAGLDVLGQRDRGHHLVHDPALLGELAAEVQRPVPEELVERFSLLEAHTTSLPEDDEIVNFWWGGSRCAYALAVSPVAA
jgi:hypothetical protein